MREAVTAGASAGMLLLSAANNLIGARAFSYSFSPRSDIELSNWKPTLHFFLGSVGSMPLQLLEVGFHVEIHAIECHDFQREIQFHGVVVA